MLVVCRRVLAHALIPPGLLSRAAFCHRPPPETAHTGELLELLQYLQLKNVTNCHVIHGKVPYGVWAQESAASLTPLFDPPFFPLPSFMVSIFDLSSL
jgi:hypothetical protein